MIFYFLSNERERGSPCVGCPLLYFRNESQRWTCKNQFSQSTTWFLRLKLKSSSLAASVFTHWGISLFSFTRVSIKQAPHLPCADANWQVAFHGFQENNVSSRRNNWKYCTRFSNKEVHCISSWIKLCAHINGCLGGLSKKQGFSFVSLFPHFQVYFLAVLRNVKVKAGRRGTSRES